MALRSFPFYKQSESKDCGPTCIKMIAQHYGRTINTQQLRSLSETTREGSSLLGLSEAFEKIGFRSLGARLSLDHLKEVSLPGIVHWNDDHYVVVYRIKGDTVHVSDPAHGRVAYKKHDFVQHWIGKEAEEGTNEGIALLVEPTPQFYSEEFEENQEYNLSFISKYLFRYKSLVLQLILGLLAASIIQLIFPFLTQSIVDVGINNGDLGFIYLILIAQLCLFVGRASLELVRSWILLHLSTRINISLVSDFFIKLMKLPISYFDARMTGDLLQRINDHERIERLLTNSSLSTLFSMFNLVVFSIVLCYYSVQIFLIFLLGSLCYFGWILFFFKKRKELDYKRFSEVSDEQSKVIELINGMQEIKLHNAERSMRWKWENVQVRLFKLAMKNLTIEQAQSVGSNFINEIKNMAITILSATLVVEGEMTLGMMVAITYIVGQLNSPISQLIFFMRDVQDAKISVDRLGEIHNQEDEERDNEVKEQIIPNKANIHLSNVSFRYAGTHKPVIEKMSLHIPANKTTAIVGASGSGKTTLMKVLLRFYEPEEGQIMVNRQKLNQISQRRWRDYCGVVMQEGYIFNATVAENIAVGQDDIDKERLARAVDIANIQEFIESLPQSYNTKIGNEGVGLSTGQKQRLLIARAVYKNPNMIFFDEATSALDAKNEKVIMEKLHGFLEERTAVVIAHRLSTVKNAHQIVVMDEGKIAELGDHESLVAKRGKYYELVKNQLELGN